MPSNNILDDELDALLINVDRGIATDENGLHVSRKTREDRFFELPNWDFALGEWTEVELTEEEKDARAEFMEYWTRMTWWGVQQGYISLDRYDLHSNYYWRDEDHREVWVEHTPERMAEIQEERRQAAIRRQERYEYNIRREEAAREARAQQASDQTVGVDPATATVPRTYASGGRIDWASLQNAASRMTETGRSATWAAQVLNMHIPTPPAADGEPYPTVSGLTYDPTPILDREDDIIF